MVKLLADLLFAYVYKNEESPHDYEIEAVANTCELLLREYDSSKYTDFFFQSVLRKMVREEEK